MRLKELVVTPEQYQALLTQCSSTETFNNLTLKQQLASVPIKIVSPEEWARRALEDADLMQRIQDRKPVESEHFKRYILGEFVTGEPDLYFYDGTPTGLVRRLVQEHGRTDRTATQSPRNTRDD